MYSACANMHFLTIPNKLSCCFEVGTCNQLQAVADRRHGYVTLLSSSKN